MLFVRRYHLRWWHNCVIVCNLFVDATHLSRFFLYKVWELEHQSQSTVEHVWSKSLKVTQNWFNELDATGDTIQKFQAEKVRTCRLNSFQSDFLPERSDIICVCSADLCLLIIVPVYHLFYLNAHVETSFTYIRIVSSRPTGIGKLFCCSRVFSMNEEFASWRKTQSYTVEKEQ